MRGFRRLGAVPRTVHGTVGPVQRRPLADGTSRVRVPRSRSAPPDAAHDCGWCFVLIGIALLLIRRVGGDAVVNGLVKVASNKPAAHDVWNIATSLLFAIAVAMIIYGW
jgi:hypothetical protein